MLLRAAAIALLGAAALTAAPADFALTGATLLPVTGPPVEDATLLVRGGKIRAMGQGVRVPAGVEVVDARGQYVLPGIIDTHSHMGVYPWPHASAHNDGNEMIHALTPHVRAEDGVHLEDPAFARARAGGVTTIQVLPGSGNLQGGQAVTLKLRPVNTLDEMRFQGAPPAMKMAMGENPKRYHVKHDQIMSRMGNAAVMREAFRRAQEYRKAWELFRAQEDGAHPLPRPTYDPKLETLGRVLAGEIRVNIHCYRKDDLLTMLRIADEFGFKVEAFHHGLEAYKIADELARRDVAVATWADWWGFKLEAWDGIPANAGILARAGVRVSLHSDSSDGVQRLYHEVAKAVRHGLSEDAALKAITLWPASILGVEERVGSLEVGKDADLAVFSHHPFDVYTRVMRTYIDGELVYQRDAEGGGAP